MNTAANCESLFFVSCDVFPPQVFFTGIFDFCQNFANVREFDFFVFGLVFAHCEAKFLGISLCVVGDDEEDEHHELVPCWGLGQEVQEEEEEDLPQQRQRGLRGFTPATGPELLHCSLHAL